MNKRIVYTNPNTLEVSIITPTNATFVEIDGNVIELRKEQENDPTFDGLKLTDEQKIQFIAGKDVPKYRAFMFEDEADEDAKIRLGVDDLDVQIPCRITDDTNIPSDRTFRNAWTDANPTETVDVDMPKAREIHMEKIREARDKKFKELDLELILALESDDAATKQANKEKKQALRDLPQTFDLTVATTPEELKALWPAELEGLR